MEGFDTDCLLLYYWEEALFGLSVTLINVYNLNHTTFAFGLGSGMGCTGSETHVMGCVIMTWLANN